MGSTLIFFYSFRSDGTFNQMFLYYILFHFLIGILSVTSLLPASLIHLKSFAHVYSVFYVIAKNVYDVYILTIEICHLQQNCSIYSILEEYILHSIVIRQKFCAPSFQTLLFYLRRYSNLVFQIGINVSISKNKTDQPSSAAV